MRNQILIVIVGLSLAIFSSCKPKTQDDGNLCSSDYDQSALLKNYANNIIIPGLETFENEFSSFKSSWDSYKTKAKSLTQLQVGLKDVYLEFQKIQCFDFGPMESQNFIEKANPFPCNQMELAKSITTANTDFSKPDRYDIGLPALETLFYGLAKSDIDSFKTAKTQEYISAIINDLHNRIKTINTDWVSYKADFLSRKGTDASSSLSLMVNALNKNFEISKRDRVGIPTGALTLGIKQANLVESPHAEFSKELLLGNLDCTKRFFQGIWNKGDGEGLDEVLDYIKASKNDIGLSIGILNNYDAMIAKLQSYSGTLKNQVVNGNSEVIALYSLMSKQLVYLKSDMPSVLCIAITYLDNPSDSD